MTYGLYLHVPLCRAKCDYCDFYSEPVAARGDARDLIDGYVGRVCAEARRRLPAFHDGMFDTVYLGGGTPSILSPEAIASLLGAVRESCAVEPGAEITIEVNPEDAVPAKLAGFRDAGITRSVLGIQTLRSEVHRTLGRASKLCTRGIMDGFFGTPGLEHCADVITGIPGQEEAEGADLTEDLGVIASYRPAHISAYTLTIEEGVPLGSRLAHDYRLELIQRELLEKTIRTLKALGYRHYEISNYCLPGCESRHNMKYWHMQPYVGLGPGAHSFYRMRRFINTSRLGEYLQSEEESLEEDFRSADAMLAEYLLTALRLLEGFTLGSVEAILGRPLPPAVYRAMCALEQEGMLSLLTEGNEVRVALSDEGLFFADAVIYQAVESLL